MTKEQIEKRLELIETEINLWRIPWQAKETPLGEKSLILGRVVSLAQEEAGLKEQLEKLNETNA